MLTHTRSLPALALALASLATAACAVDAPVDDAVDETAAADDPALRGGRFFTCAESPADVVQSWPAGANSVTLALPTWADSANFCGSTVGLVDHLPATQVHINVTGPREAQGNPSPSHDVLEYKVYGFSTTFCPFCSTQWVELASGSAVGIHRVLPNGQVLKIYPTVNETVLGSTNYSALRVAVKYTDGDGSERPTTVVFSR